MLFSFPAGADYVDVTEKQIKTKFYANGFVFSADSGQHYNRLGIGYGWRNTEYEFHLGLHDNLLPYADLSYNAEHIKTIFNLYVETEDTEIKPKVIYGAGATLLLSESFGFHVAVEKKTWLVGFRKWF